MKDFFLGISTGEQIPLDSVDSLEGGCLNIGPLEASLDGAGLSCFSVLFKPPTNLTLPYW